MPLLVPPLPETPGSPGACFAPAPDAPGSLVGLEHEYSLTRDGQPLDFRTILHTLPVPGLRLDPGDINAYRLRSGLALTADGAEAELATPPISVQPGFAAEVELWAAMARTQLDAVLPAGVEASGYSTHISVALPGVEGEPVARLYARTFAAAFAFLIENTDSQGIYIRPRTGRLELCGDFVDGPRLGEWRRSRSGVCGHARPLWREHRWTCPRSCASSCCPAQTATAGECSAARMARICMRSLAKPC